MTSPKLRFLGSLILLLLWAPLFAQLNLSAPLPTDPNVKIGKLPNGLTYYIHQNFKPAKKVELRLVVNTGSVLEDPDQRGLAHFMEHMGFNGSRNFPKNELVDYLQKVGVKFGADLNAYTSFDETVYILPISTEDPEVVEKGFTVLEDWAFNNSFDPAEIEKERGVVLEESRLSKGAWERMSRQYFPRLFNGSLYAERLPIGNDTVLRTFKPETLQRFYKQWYRPDLMAVVVVGDLDPAEAEKKIIAHFGKFQNPPNAKARPSVIPIKPRTAPEAIVVTDEEETNTTLQIYNFIKPVEPIKTGADYRKVVVESMLTALINQRLQEQTQKENPPFAFAYTGMTPFLRGYRAFTSYAALGDNPPEEAVNALVGETERARQYGFLAAELERAKANLLNQAERAYNERDKSESGQIVWQYVNNYLQGTPIPGPEYRYRFAREVLPTITLEEVNALAKQMPATDNAFTLITAPARLKDKLPGNNQLLQTVVAATQKPVTAYEEKAVAEKLFDKEPTPGKVTGETKNEKLGTTSITLSNGVTVTLKPTDFKNDQVLMDAWRWGGYHTADLADKDNAKHAAHIVREMGVRDLSPSDLRKYLSGKTVNVYPYLNAHEEGIEGSSSVRDFETLLQLTHLYLTRPRRDEALFNSFVKKQKSQVQFLRQDPQLFFMDTVNKILYDNHPWASDFPTEEEFAGLKLDRAFGIYSNIFSNAHGLHFTFVGNVDPATARPLLEKYLGSLPATPKENRYKDNKVRPVKGVVNARIKRGKEQQSFIRLTFTGETDYNYDEALALQALLDVLNIKVVEKLREEMAGIYGGGFSGSIQKRPYTHYIITASVPCGPENVDSLSAALMRLVKTAQAGGLQQKDLDKVKETWKKNHKVALQSNNAWLASLSNAWIDRNDPENILRYEQKVNALTLQDLQKVARKYLNGNNYVRVVLYPEAAKVAEDPKPAKAF